MNRAQLIGCVVVSAILLATSGSRKAGGGFTTRFRRAAAWTVPTSAVLDRLAPPRHAKPPEAQQHRRPNAEIVYAEIS